MDPAIRIDLDPSMDRKPPMDRDDLAPSIYREPPMYRKKEDIEDIKIEGDCVRDLKSFYLFISPSEKSKLIGVDVIK
ncbi:hypothetical protein COLO4_17987 [Corchorus olitorius]|uniref:Uncharacterized protein n=1 Tax=Corchorus olitorius TaxID=93759 RepID=A0A1R3JB30_9ROSI|nr:hypothetical protein COLO4_17987 [Corchorus olitorius]